jgi:hypothetical protein
MNPNPNVNHSPIAEFQSWAGICEQPEAAVKIEGPYNRLTEPDLGCQLFRGGDSAGECGAPAAPAEVHSPRFRKDEASRTQLRLCPECFVRSVKLRPTVWLESALN